VQVLLEVTIAVLRASIMTILTVKRDPEVQGFIGDGCPMWASPIDPFSNWPLFRRALQILMKIGYSPNLSQKMGASANRLHITRAQWRGMLRAESFK